MRSLAILSIGFIITAAAVAAFWFAAPSLGGDADTEAARRSNARHWAGVAIAFANLGFPFVLVVLRFVLVPLLFKNENSLGWYAFFTFLFSIAHMLIMLIYLIVRLAIPEKHRSSGTVTLVLACLPWVEWLAFYIYIRMNGY